MRSKFSRLGDRVLHLGGFNGVLVLSSFKIVITGPHGFHFWTVFVSGRIPNIHKKVFQYFTLTMNLVSTKISNSINVFWKSGQ